MSAYGQWYEFNDHPASAVYQQLKREAYCFGGIYNWRAEAFEAGYLGKSRPYSIEWDATGQVNNTIDAYYLMGKALR